MAAGGRFAPMWLGPAVRMCQERRSGLVGVHDRWIDTSRFTRGYAKIGFVLCW